MKNIHEKFFKMETEDNLFSLQLSDGTYYWDIIRREIFSEINSYSSQDRVIISDSGEFGSGFLVALKDKIKFLLNKLSTSYIVRKKPSYIFTTYQRSKKDDLPFDNIMDPLYEGIDAKKVCIEHINLTYINLLKMIVGKRTRIPPVYVYRSKFDYDIEKINKIIGYSIKCHFDIALDVRYQVSTTIQNFLSNYLYYKDLFKIHAPKAIICSDNGSLKGLYLAAKEADIPALEVQHGASPGSILWSYAKEKNYTDNQLFLPAIFLTFSDYWNSLLDFPVKKKITIGNNYFFMPKIEGKGGVVFISKRKLNKEFLNIASDLEELNPDLAIYFKIHPQDYSRESAIIDLLQKGSKIKVITNKMSDSDLLQQCSHVVAQRSSFIYAALQSGKRIYLYKKYNYDWDEELLKSSSLFSSSKQLSLAIEEVKDKSKLNIINRNYFEEYDSEKFIKLIENL